MEGSVSLLERGCREEGNLNESVGLAWGQKYWFALMVFNIQHPCVCVCVCSVASTSLRPHGLWPTRLLYPWNFQARILERVAISYSRESSHLRDQTHIPVSLALADRFFTTEPPGTPFQHTERYRNKQRSKCIFM